MPTLSSRNRAGPPKSHIFGLIFFLLRRGAVRAPVGVLIALLQSILLAGAPAGAAEPPDFLSPARNLESFKTELAQVRARKMRWQGVIRTSEMLSKDPGAYARTAELAGRDLKYLGRELSVEGLTGGLSSYLGLISKYLKYEKKAKLAKTFKIAAASLVLANKAFIKDLARRPDKPSDGAIRLLESTDASLKLLATAVIPDSNVRAIVSISTSFGTQGVKWLSAYARGDQKSIKDHLPAIKTVLSTFKGVTRALADGVDPLALEGALKSLAGRYPRLKPLAQLAAATALTNFYISLSLANVAWGSYAYVNGYRLLEQAEEIRRNQRRAAGILAKLVPQARAELAAARAREQFLLDAIDGIGPLKTPPPRILPSRRFFDDGLGVPVPPRQAAENVLSVIVNVPPIEYGPTLEELQRREEARQKAARIRRMKAEAAKRADEELERARQRARELERARQRAAERERERIRRKNREEARESRTEERRSGSREEARPLKDVVDYPSVRDKINSFF